VSDRHPTEKAETLFVLPEGFRPCPPEATPEGALIVASVRVYEDGSKRVHLEKHWPDEGKLDRVTFDVEGLEK
jgi:hypothetical protein